MYLALCHNLYLDNYPSSQHLHEMGIVFNTDLLTNLKLLQVNLGLEPTQVDSGAEAFAAWQSCADLLQMSTPLQGPPTCDSAQPGSQGGIFQSFLVACEADLQLRQFVENAQLGPQGLHPSCQRDGPGLRRRQREAQPALCTRLLWSSSTARGQVG